MVNNPEFGPLLRAFREARRVPLREFALALGLDASYLSRLERAERPASSVALVDRLAAALDCAPDETDALRAAAGFPPEPIARLGLGDPDLLLAARLLDPSDPEVSAATRTVLRALARLRRPAPPVEGGPAQERRDQTSH